MRRISKVIMYIFQQPSYLFVLKSSAELRSFWSWQSSGPAYSYSKRRESSEADSGRTESQEEPKRKQILAVDQILVLDQDLVVDQDLVLDQDLVVGQDLVVD